MTACGTGSRSSRYRPSPRSRASSSSRGSGRPTQVSAAGHGNERILRGMGGLRAELKELLEAVRRGEVEPEEALERLRELPYRDLGFARVDLHRELRQGAPEVVLAEGKRPEQVAAIVAALLEGGAGSVLVTRADAEVRAAVRAVARRRAARTRGPGRSGSRARRRAGTVAYGLRRHVRRPRAARGAHPGRPARHGRHVHEDVGVAGLHRLGSALADLARADCVVVVAGMDGALASVVGGLVACPVIGVPTSVGYGSARGGRDRAARDALLLRGRPCGRRHRRRLRRGNVAARIARRGRRGAREHDPSAIVEAGAASPPLCPWDPTIPPPILHPASGTRDHPLQSRPA